MTGRLLLPAFLLVSCASPPAPRDPDAGGTVAVELDRSGYALGDSARVTVRNSGTTLIRFAFACDLSLEGWTGSGWGVVWEPDCSSVRVRPEELPPGARIASVLPMNPCPAGALSRYAEFRARLRYQLPDGRDGAVPSRPFAVRAP